MESCLKFRSVLLIIEQFIIDQLSGTILLINVNSACTIYQLCVFSFSCDKYERSVVRILIQLWLKSISCYMIDQLWVFLYSRGRLFNGLRYCHENFLQYFHPFTRCMMVLKKSASCVIDTPLLPPWSIAFRYFHPEWKKKKNRHRCKRHFR